MKVDYEAAISLARRLGVSTHESHVGDMQGEDARFEHLVHEIGHALLLLRHPSIRFTLARGASELSLSSLIDIHLRETRCRRKYRDEAHVLVATYRVLRDPCGATWEAFELVSREQSIKRHEIRAALRSPRARVLEFRLRSLLLFAGALKGNDDEATRA